MLVSSLALQLLSGAERKQVRSKNHTIRLRIRNQASCRRTSLKFATLCSGLALQFSDANSIFNFDL